MFPPGTTLADYIPGSVVAEDGTVYLDNGARLKCRWVLLCKEPATCTVSHPILGQVQTCQQHAGDHDATPLVDCRWCGKQIHQLNEPSAREVNKVHPADAAGNPAAKPGDWAHGVTGIRCSDSEHEHQPDDTDN
ncbi:hypothetical protein ADL03_15995 [Nocardia sp. NRRL S-836]|nr:hypothetical protein ADL03_15995 [Nocardia sp. NRRL S-836]